jgi:hypothetical protein
VVKALHGPRYEFSSASTVAAVATHIWVTNHHDDSMPEINAATCIRAKSCDPVQCRIDSAIALSDECWSVIIHGAAAMDGVG